MEAPDRVDAEKGEMKAKLENLIEKGKAVYARLQDQTVAATKATDRTIRGLGVVIGVLLARSRCD